MGDEVLALTLLDELVVEELELLADVEDVDSCNTRFGLESSTT